MKAFYDVKKLIKSLPSLEQLEALEHATIDIDNAIVHRIENTLKKLLTLKGDLPNLKEDGLSVWFEPVDESTFYSSLCGIESLTVRLTAPSGNVYHISYYATLAQTIRRHNGSSQQLHWNVKQVRDIYQHVSDDSVVGVTLSDKDRAVINKVRTLSLEGLTQKRGEILAELKRIEDNIETEVAAIQAILDRNYKAEEPVKPKRKWYKFWK